MIVLNVGGGPTRQLPSNYDGWTQWLLDIDPSVKPDICIDAKELKTLESGQFDAVYCSHNLEHFYANEVPAVLSGFLHVLKIGGSVEIAVPNLRNLFESLLTRNLDINDVWYRAGDAPITFHDVLYGWGAQIEMGNTFYAHKCGFTRLSLIDALQKAGFENITVAEQGGNIFAKATKSCQ